MTSADEKIARAIIANGCPLTELELEIETGLRYAAVRNGIKELLRAGRLRVIKDRGTYLYEVTR